MTEAGVFGGVAIQGERPMRNVFVVDEQVELLFWVIQSHHFLLKRVQIRRALDDENANNDSPNNDKWTGKTGNGEFDDKENEGRYKEKGGDGENAGENGKG